MSDATATGDGLDLVTGAFGNVGAAITARLRTGGRRVRTLTSQADPGVDGIEVRPFDFDDPTRLAGAFDGVDTFYNTYWKRTGWKQPGGRSPFGPAVERSAALLRAAEAAGVRRIVHLSVANADLGPQYPYFRAKAEVESLLRSGMTPYAVIRPALIFGGRAPMLDQLAKVLRRSPLFAIAGDGNYRVRPVHVDDVARLCVESDAALGADPIDAVGPERPTFEEFVRAVRAAVGARTGLIHLPPRAVLGAARLLGTVARDDLLTRDELMSTIEGLADTDGPATGRVSFTSWLAEHGTGLGRQTA